MKILFAIVAITFSIAAIAPNPAVHLNVVQLPYTEPIVKKDLLFPEVHAYLAHKKTVHCLATMVYGEARGESRKGQIAVAYTAKNRAKKKENICKEVVKPYQYSVFNGKSKLKQVALDPSKVPPKTNAAETKSWEDANIVAEQVYSSAVPDPTRGATHYYNPVLTRAQGYKTPKWAHKFKLAAIIEKHKFFKA